MSERIAVPGFDRKLDLKSMGTEEVMRLHADTGDELERRYIEAKRQQRERADRGAASDGPPKEPAPSSDGSAKR